MIMLLGAMKHNEQCKIFWPDKISKIKVFSIFGTRPKVIKMASVIKELERWQDVFDSFVVITGQHKEMCDPYLQLFSIVSDIDL